MSAGFGIFPPKFHHQYLFHIELLIRISFFSAINEKSGSWPAICNHSRGENEHWLDCELWRCKECYNGKGCFLYHAYIFLLTFNLTWTSLLILFWLKKVLFFKILYTNATTSHVNLKGCLSKCSGMPSLVWFLVGFMSFILLGFINSDLIFLSLQYWNKDI